MKYLLYAFVMVLPAIGLAQNRTVSGKVTSAEDGSALPGVNVLLKGTTEGTVTDSDGNFSIEVNGSSGTLVFSFIGLKTEEVELGSQVYVGLKMQTDINQLTEVIITGAGERDKNSYTGSITAVNADKIENRPVATVDQVLQGSVPGLQLSASSGTPGSVQNIRIRGRSSITAGNEPLYVIDGIPVYTGENDVSTSTSGLSVLSSLNPNDIESMSVLKDATATAIYGARGANGVIIITTKKGKAGKPLVSFSAQTGFVSRAVEGPKMLNASQREELYYESRVNAGDAASIDEAKTEYPSGWDGVTDTNWGDVLTNDDAKTASYDISVRGGNDRSNYYSSVGYFKQDGVNVGSNYKRITGKFNVTTALGKKISLENATTGAYSLQNGQLEGAAYFGNSELGKLFLSPWDKAYNDDGTINTDLSSSVFNPLYIAANDINRKRQVRAMNNTVLKFDITDRLRFTSSLGIDYIVTDELYYDNRVHGDGVDVDDDGNDGASYTYMNRNFNWVWKNMLDYSIEIGAQSKLAFKAIYEAQKNKYYTIGTGGIAIAADGLYYPSSVATPDFASGYENDWAINSLTGMVNYAFSDRIFVDATLRSEGNSRFAPGNRWGTFYSLGASWVLSREAFLSGITWLNLAKLRGSYGRTGNAAIDLNEYQSFLTYDGSYDGSAAVYPDQLGNDQLSWEKSNSWNIGIDAEFFGRISATVEYFNRTSYDLLLDVPLSRTTGFTSQYQNVGEMVNKGIEASINVDVIKTQSFKWTVGGNITSLNNEVTKLPKTSDGDEIGIVGTTQIVTEGEAAYTWNLKTWAGVDPTTGAPLWYVNGRSGETTSTYSKATAVTQNASALATLYGAVNTYVEYKGIYLSGSLYFSGGNKVYDQWAGYTQSDGRYTFTYNAYARQYDRWQQAGDVSENPKNVYGNTSNSNAASTRRLYDGDFMRLRDVTVGYNFPKSLISTFKLTNLGIYVRGTNLWTHVSDSNLEFDPEVKPDGELDLTAPPLKSVVLGIKLDF